MIKQASYCSRLTLWWTRWTTSASRRWAPPRTWWSPLPPQAQVFRMRDLAMREEAMREVEEQRLPVGLGRLEKVVARQAFLRGDTAGGAGGRWQSSHRRQSHLGRPPPAPCGRYAPRLRPSQPGWQHVPLSCYQCYLVAAEGDSQAGGFGRQDQGSPQHSCLAGEEA